MPKNNVNKYFETSFVSNPNLRTYFGRVVKGQPKVFTTPFAKGESTAHLLENWIVTLKSIDREWPSLVDYELDLAKKVGPMSIMLPLKDRMKDIESYYDGILLPSKPLSDKSVKAVIAEWARSRGLAPRDITSTINKMKLSTNSGSPFFRKRRNVIGDTLPITALYPVGESVFQHLGTGQFTAAAILGWRGQEGGPEELDTKQRVVWMFPLAVNIEELRVYQPVIEGAQRNNIVPAWVSMDAVDDRITQLFDTKGKDDLVVCTDFSAFDQHFNSSLQIAARSILAAILDTRKSSLRWLDEIFPIKYMIPLVYDYGKVKFGKHGMGSGSGGTNCDETLAHRALQYEAAQLAGARLNPNSQCLGDDGVLSYPGITVKDVVDAYTSHGLEMNESKQYASTQDCTYLRRWHHKDYRVNGVCVGVYSTCRALGRLRYLERYQDPEYWDEKAVALRQLSILENVKWHPLKEQFVQYCMKRDKYRLGLDIPNFFSNIRKVAEEKIDHMPDLLGYVQTLQSTDELGGIENWWIVKYLSSMK